VAPWTQSLQLHDASHFRVAQPPGRAPGRQLTPRIERNRKDIFVVIVLARSRFVLHAGLVFRDCWVQPWAPAAIFLRNALYAGRQVGHFLQRSPRFYVCVRELKSQPLVAGREGGRCSVVGNIGLAHIRCIACEFAKERNDVVANATHAITGSVCIQQAFVCRADLSQFRTLLVHSLIVSRASCLLLVCHCAIWHWQQLPAGRCLDRPKQGNEEQCWCSLQPHLHALPQG
jgi:hypothetical protein